MGTQDGGVVGTTQILNNGPAATRWNLALLSEGYQMTQLPQFASDAQRFVDTLLHTSPFDKLSAAINAFRVDVHSTDAGAADPVACGGSGATPRTYFDSAFCNSGIRRALCVNNVTAMSVANLQVPQHHVVFVLVNTQVYGGTGGGVAVFSMAPGAMEIGLHEMGHTAFGLADEYDNYAGCGSGEIGHDRYSGGEPVQPNITTQFTRATNKWARLVLTSTPMPTTSNPNCATCDPQASSLGPDTVGTFEGGGYYHCGIFRPAFNCRMRALGYSFCGVCEDRIVKTLTPHYPGPLPKRRAVSH